MERKACHKHKGVAKVYVGVLGILVVIVVFTFSLSTLQSTSGKSKNGKLIEVYYSDGCGCCINYMGYLRDSGFEVKPMMVNDIDAEKGKLNIPNNLRSCHTSKIDGYFIEGHMPIEAINKLLEEKPEIDGIALPGMPSGSPGMPGYKKATFEIFAVNGSQPVKVFMEL